ncbi:MAG: hypothetical protein H7Y17_05735, partial [Chlorobia bacterium]|nr:hypothetical protein [Fimbriimonadaceae bacterium]
MDGANWYRVEPVAAGLQPAQGPDSQAEGLRLRFKTNASKIGASRFFRLDQNAQETEAKILEIGPELKPAIDQLKGIRLMRPSSLVETLFTFLCTANNNLHRIIPMCWKLGTFGEPLDHGLHAFPSVVRVAQIDEQELRSAGFGYRGATIPKAAQALKERGAENWLEQLKTADYPTIHAELCSLPGIGPKLADCIALYGFEKGEAVPLDTHIWQAFTRLYHPEWKDKAV